jgi:hypothetical protein
MRLPSLAALLAGCSLLSLPGCAAQKDATREEAAAKATAPVTVDAALTPGHARVTVRFLSGASRVGATVRGLDGLTLTAPPALGRSEFKAQETAVLEVPLTSAAGTLAVYVSGTFDGIPWSRAVTFAVGPAIGPSDSGVVQTDQGPLKAMPAGK